MGTPIDDYLAEVSDEALPHLDELRAIIVAEAPEASERISWGMPTWQLNGNLVHIAAQRHHAGFYPGADGVRLFEDELGEWKHSKGAIQFPYDKPIPADLVRRIVRMRVEQQQAKGRN